MKRIPARPDIGHLKKQAKELLALYRFRDALPAASGKDDEAIAAQGLRLHDAQSCVAREYGFVSWPDLKDFVLARTAQADDPVKAVFHWLRLVYAGDIAGQPGRVHAGRSISIADRLQWASLLLRRGQRMTS